MTGSAPLASPCASVHHDVLPDAELGSISHGGTDGHGESHAYDTLYLLFWAVILGTAVLQLATLPKFRALPVTVVFFVLGIICALVVEVGLLDVLGMHTAHRSYTSWASIDPHLLLFTFLPPLLFSDAMTIDTHVALRTYKQCLILAVPGVVIGALATAVVLKLVLPYGWTWEMCIMVGSILAATDPVAVVSLLKDLGASPMLTMLIQGEALLNDGTAMVLFSVAYGMVAGRERSIGDILTFLVTSTAGAMLVGASIGFVGFLWIRSASDKLNHNSSTIQICVTLACAYWSFIFAEGICHISGVLSTVAAAIVLAQKMWPVLVEREAMTEIWHFIETFSNTLVFFLAGMLTGKGLPQYKAQDFLWALVVYAAVSIIRLGMLLSLRPLLNRSGSRVSYEDIGVMTWGGLRGMVGLALAILVNHDLAEGKMTQDDGEHVLFLVGGVAALTLILNATTAPRLCELLGVSDAPEGRQVLVRKVVRRAEAHVKDSVDKLVASTCKPPRAWADGPVYDSVSRLRRTLQQHAARTSSSFGRMESKLSRIAERGLQALRETLPEPDVEALWLQFEDHKEALIQQTGSDALAFRFEDMLTQIKRVLEPNSVDTSQLKTVREVFLEAVRASYWDQLQTGRFVAGSREPWILLNSVGVAKHACGRCLADWKVLEQDIEVPHGDFVEKWSSSRPAQTYWLGRFQMLAGWTKWLEEQRLKQHFQKQLQAIHIIGAFAEAHARAQRQIASYFGDNEKVDTAEEAYVILESQTSVFRAVMLLSRIAKPTRKKMHTLSEVHCISQRYRRFVLDAHASGVLHAKEAETLLHPVDETMRALDRDRREMSGALLRECLHRSGSAESSGSRCRATREQAAHKIQRIFKRWRKRRKAEAPAPTWPSARGSGGLAPTLLRRQAAPMGHGKDFHPSLEAKSASAADFLFDEEAQVYGKVRVSQV